MPLAASCGWPRHLIKAVRDRRCTRSGLSKRTRQVKVQMEAGRLHIKRSVPVPAPAGWFLSAVRPGRSGRDEGLLLDADEGESKTAIKLRQAAEPWRAQASATVEPFLEVSAAASVCRGWVVHQLSFHPTTMSSFPKCCQAHNPSMCSIPPRGLAELGKWSNDAPQPTQSQGAARPRRDRPGE